MTRQSAIDQAVRRGFRKLYPYKPEHRMKFILDHGLRFISDLEHQAVLMAWDRIDFASQNYPSPTPKSAGPQAQHSDGGRG